MVILFYLVALVCVFSAHAVEVCDDRNPSKFLHTTRVTIQIGPFVYGHKCYTWWLPNYSVKLDQKPVFAITLNDSVIANRFSNQTKNSTANSSGNPTIGVQNSVSSQTANTAVNSNAVSNKSTTVWIVGNLNPEMTAIMMRLRTDKDLGDVMVTVGIMVTDLKGFQVQTFIIDSWEGCDKSTTLKTFNVSNQLQAVPSFYKAFISGYFENSGQISVSSILDNELKSVQVSATVSGTVTRFKITFIAYTGSQMTPIQKGPFSVGGMIGPSSFSQLAFGVKKYTCFGDACPKTKQCLTRSDCQLLLEKTNINAKINSNQATCQACESSFQLIDKACVCPLPKMIDPNSGRCTKNPCATVPNSIVIVKQQVYCICMEGYYFSKGQCISICPTFMTWNQNSGECTCPQSSYYDGNTCLACPANQYFNSVVNSCQCLKGFHPGPNKKDPCFICEKPFKQVGYECGANTESLTDCPSCSKYCKVVSLDYKCLQCSLSTILINGKCLSCPPQYFWDQSENLCYHCSLGCVECSSAVNCLKCPLDSVLYTVNLNKPQERMTFFTILQISDSAENTISYCQKPLKISSDISKNIVKGTAFERTFIVENVPPAIMSVCQSSSCNDLLSLKVSIGAEANFTLTNINRSNIDKSLFDPVDPSEPASDSAGPTSLVITPLEPITLVFVMRIIFKGIAPNVIVKLEVSLKQGYDTSLDKSGKASSEAVKAVLSFNPASSIRTQNKFDPKSFSQSYAGLNVYAETVIDTSTAAENEQSNSGIRQDKIPFPKYQSVGLDVPVQLVDKTTKQTTIQIMTVKFLP